MGRPPHSGGPAFRFTHSEVMEMEACLQDVNNLNNSIPPRETILALAEKFSASVDRAGKMIVQPKQVLNWFQNRRYTHKAKVKEPPKNPGITVFTRDDSAQFRNVAPPFPVSQGKNLSDNVEMEFEAKSARDGAWVNWFTNSEIPFFFKIIRRQKFLNPFYTLCELGAMDPSPLPKIMLRYDVLTFLSYRMLEPGDPEVRIRFSGFGVEEDEWINVRKCVRQRSLPCEGAECIAVLPGDLILCFQEGKEQALYFDAHILDAQRRRHDVRGCRCRFLVRYDHDQAEEIVSLKKICRRPETDCRLEFFQSTAKAGGIKSNSSKRMRKRRKFIDVNSTVPTETEMAVVEEIMTNALPSISNSNTCAAVAAAAATSESNGAMAAPLSPIHQDTVRAEIEDSLNN